MRRVALIALALSLAPLALGEGQATIPDRFRGRWAGSHDKCGVPSEGSLAIYADRIDFYESRGRVLAVKIVSDREIEVELGSSGEGRTWQDMRRFRLSEDGRSLTDVTIPKYQAVRVRCEKAD
jgi:hypothetical protein